jgi:hypothetical protein
MPERESMRDRFHKPPTRNSPGHRCRYRFQDGSRCQQIARHPTRTRGYCWRHYRQRVLLPGRRKG